MNSGRIFFYILIREFMQNVDPPPPSFCQMSIVHVLRPSEPEKMVLANVSVCVSVDFSLLAR